MTKTIDKLEANARRANAALRAAKRDMARRDREAFVSAKLAFADRCAELAGADTAEAMAAMSDRLSDDVLRRVIEPPAPVEAPQWGAEG